MSKRKPKSLWHDNVFHVEVPLGIINIRPYLQTEEKKPCVSIEIIPDEGVEVVLTKHNVRMILNEL